MKNAEKSQEFFDKTLNLLDSTGLNWEVKKEQLSLIRNVDGGEPQILPINSFGIMKGDTHLATVGKQYVPFQNYQLAETIIAASEDIGIVANSGGALKGNRKVYIQAELPKMLIGKSELKRYITALNSHDGSSSIGFGSSNTNVICENTFYMAYKEVNKFRHTVSAENRIKAAIGDLRMSMNLDEKLMTTFKRMADIQLNDNIVERVLVNMFKIDTNAAQSSLSSIKKEQISQFASSLSTSIAEQGKTIWALFNGVTRYTNHVSAPKDTDGKLNYIMGGTGYDLNVSSYNEIMDWVTANTPSNFVTVQ